ncbi:MAG TPA: hypothetical protein VIL97_09515, partial [Thermoanaerobaculia bacterium]
ETLAAAARGAHFAAYYTDAISHFLEPAANGKYASKQKLRIFATDFDRDLLYLDNYIPLTTLLVERDIFLDLGGFDPSFDLFEDWDFLLRLSRRGSFLRIPRVTCEIRHFSGGDSAVLMAPAGSVEFRNAKLAVWNKHREFVTDGLIATVFERQKERLNHVSNQLIEERGRSSHLELDVTRLQREGDRVVGELQSTGHRARELEFRLVETAALLAKTESVLGETRSALDSSGAVADAYKRQLVEYQRDAAQKDRALRELFAEVDRLTGLLEQIYASRTWKVHQLVERLKGRNA